MTKNNKEKLKEDIKKETKKGIWWKITFNGKQQLMEVLKCGAVEFVWCRGHCIYNSGALPSERYCSTLEHYLLKGTAPLWSTTFRKVLLHSGALPSERYCSRVEHYLSEGSAPTVSLSIPRKKAQRTLLDLHGPPNGPLNGPSEANFWGPLVKKGPAGSLHGPNWSIFLDRSLDNVQTWIYSPVWGQSDIRFLSNRDFPKEEDDSPPGVIRVKVLLSSLLKVWMFFARRFDRLLQKVWCLELTKIIVVFGFNLGIY